MTAYSCEKLMLLLSSLAALVMVLAALVRQLSLSGVQAANFGGISISTSGECKGLGGMSDSPIFQKRGSMGQAARSLWCSAKLEGQECCPACPAGGISASSGSEGRVSS